MTLDLAVLVSGGGSNLQSIIDRIEQGALDARIRIVVSNKPDAYGLERAKTHGIPTHVIRHTDFDSREAFDREMVRVIREAGADAIVLAGFMRILTPEFLDAFPNRVLNIHPALLPSFPGIRGQADAADYGVRFAGCTVHFVDNKMDHGPVVIQAVVPCYPEDDGASLGKRILELEHRIYPQAVQWLAEGRLVFEGRKVVVRDAGKKPAAVASGSPFMVNPPLEEGF